MTHNVTISATINTTDAATPLGCEVWINDVLAIDVDHVSAPITLSHSIPDENDQEHVLKFVLKNKLPEHTQIDHDGNILKDAMLVISDLEFDGIALGHAFNQLAEYRHNLNSSADEVVDTFHGSMGCNGSVTLNFTTPAYLWMLEHI